MEASVSAGSADSLPEALSGLDRSPLSDGAAIETVLLVRPAGKEIYYATLSGSQKEICYVTLPGSPIGLLDWAIGRGRTGTVPSGRSTVMEVLGTGQRRSRRRWMAVPPASPICVPASTLVAG